jgi:hypothetical protein
MSANRSVQAAQRRRAGGPEPAAPGRGPQPSISSSQMFTGQPQHPANGRLAGQQAQLQQQQMQQQRQQQMQPQGGAESGVSKISIAQAITLITLRLGKAELQLYELAHQMAEGGVGHQFNSSAEGAEGMVLIDQNLIDSIMSRLESLEKRSATSTGAGSSSADVTLLKQQFEAIKPSIAQNTKVATALTKEQKEHKLIVDALKSELSETKELLAALQAMSMDNSQKIFELMSGEQLIADGNLEEDLEQDLQVDDVESEEVSELLITGNSLKGLIEQELNA